MKLDLPFHKNKILFGQDSTPRLIAFEMEGADKIKVFSRDTVLSPSALSGPQGRLREGVAKDPGKVVSSLVPFSPFLLLADDKLLQGWKGNCSIESLKGDNFFRYLAFFPSWDELGRAKNYLQKTTGKTPTAQDAPYLFLTDPVLQHLLITGQTHFLELPFKELLRLQLDIETYCGQGFEFSNPKREQDRIIAVTLSDSTGWEKLIPGKELPEKEMLLEMVNVIRERDPDVIEGHNLFRFDLEYIEERARRYGIELALGRDGSLLKGHPSRMQIAERAITYTKYEIFGRHIVDTWILAQHYDITARELESYGLKDIAKHFELAQEDRTYILPEKISWYFDNDPDTLFHYAMDDVRETRALGELLSQSYFAQAQIFPYSYQNVILRGNATKIDSLFLRDYIRERHSIPKPSQPIEVTGGYTDIFYQGVAKGVLHCDITSLYPSIMLTYRCFPKKDSMEIFPSLLRDLKDFRVKAKEMLRKAENEEERKYLDALQSTFKILINSFYGYLGFDMGHFNDFEEANRVTSTGREIIKGMVAWLKEAGCKIIEIDTDGIYFVPPENIKSQQGEEKLIEELSKALPEGINLELDSRYQAMFSYKMKNYALLGYDGKLLIKGSGLKSRGLELFQRKYMEDMFLLLLKGEKERIKDLLRRYAEDLENHRLDVQVFMKTETLQDSLETYKDKIKGKKRNPSAPYELALKSERPYQPGDQVSFYVTGTGKNIKVHENCKLASQWAKDKPDENVEYYKAKLLDLHEKFEPYFA